jgi:hypothetical protein
VSDKTQREAQYWRDRLAELTDQELVAWVRARARDKAQAEETARSALAAEAVANSIRAQEKADTT